MFLRGDLVGKVHVDSGLMIVFDPDEDDPRLVLAVNIS